MSQTSDFSPSIITGVPQAALAELAVPADSSASVRKLDYLPTLDGWRAIAITFVLLAHGAPSLSASTSGASDIIFRAFPSLGQCGVRIFFGISGFLICSRLIDEYKKRGYINLKFFYIRRFFRIIPPLFIMVSAVALLSAAGEIHVSLEQIIAGVLFAGNYIRGNGSWYLGHLWSLAVEEHFYILFPGLLVIVGVRRGLHASILLALGVALWRSVLMKIQTGHSIFDSAYFWGRSDIVADGLLWGCAVAFLFQSPFARTRLRRLLRPVYWWPVFACMILSISSVAAMPDWKATLLVYSLQSLLIPFLLAGTVLHPTSIAGTVLELRLSRRIGRLSYSIYLWQQLFLVLPNESARHLSTVQGFPINIICITILAILSFYIVESPMIRLGYRWARSIEKTQSS